MPPEQIVEMQNEQTVLKKGDMLNYLTKGACFSIGLVAALLTKLFNISNMEKDNKKIENALYLNITGFKFLIFYFIINLSFYLLFFL